MMPRRHPLVGALLILVACRAPAEAPPAEAPAPDHAPPHAEAVHLGPDALAAARLTVAPAALGRLAPEVASSARITLDPTRHALVGAWVQGQVDEIRVRPGDHLRAGHRLASIHTPELGAAVGDYRGASVRLGSARERRDRLLTLQEGGVSSGAQVLEAQSAVAEAESALEAAEERLRVLGVDPAQGEPTRGEHYPAHVPVTSPIAGEVLQVLASVGQHVAAGDPLFRIGDLDHVWLLADVFEGDLSRVKEGQHVSFTVDAWPGEAFTGTLEQVGSWVEPTSRTVEVRAVVPNPDHRLKPNMFARATIVEAGGAGPEGIVLPEEAVVTVDGAPAVFVQEGPGDFVVHGVRVGARAGGRALVTGISPGAPVVVGGAFTLKSELEKAELGGGHGH